MTFLLVDDEFYSLENLKQKLCSFLPADTIVLTAFNKKQALDILQKHSVDIMICDIEMPGGSGLELLDEIRETGNELICIFLTAYDRFDYVSKALRLASIDYLLKPVDLGTLETSVLRAIHRRNEQMQTLQNKQQADYWRNSELFIIESIFYGILRGEIAANHEVIKESFLFRNISSSPAEKHYHLILMQCLPSPERTLEWNQFDFIIKNVLREYFYSSAEFPYVLRLSQTLYLLPLSAETHDRESILEQCRNAFSTFATYFQDSFNFYISADHYPVESLRQEADLLSELANRNVNISNQVFDMVRPFLQESPDAHALPLGKWKELLQRQQYDELRKELMLCLASMQHKEHIYREHLVSFYYEVYHMLYEHIQEYAPDRITVFQQDMLRYNEVSTCSDFVSLKEWVAAILQLTDQCLATAIRGDKTVLQVRKYIKEHLSEEMTRDSLASLVYLNPDYLSYLFKKETGFSITAYVIEERIREAKRLLSTTDLPIRDIAIACGFQNLSYFSRQFRKSTGMSPRDFRV